MIYLVDTNVLLRSIQQTDPMHADAKRATAALTRQDQQLSIVAQNLIEFWAVATRPQLTMVLPFRLTKLPDTSSRSREYSRCWLILPIYFSNGNGSSSDIR